MNQLVYDIISFVILISAFVFGMIRLFRHGKPMYFQMTVCAVGCFALEELWVFVNSLCGNENSSLTVRFFGLFGRFCFLLDRFVDEHSGGDAKKAKLCGFIAPVLLTVGFFAIPGRTVGELIVEAVVFVPAVVSSYFNLKHILLPPDEAGLLRATRATDILALVFYAINCVSFIPALFASEYIGIIRVLMASVMATVAVLSERGAKKWETLV